MLHRATHATLHVMVVRLADLALSASEINVPANLADCRNRSVGELASDTATKPTTLTSVLDRLVHTGYVTRELDPSDRRSFRVSLTADGRDVADAVRTAVDDLERGAHRDQRHRPGRIPDRNPRPDGGAPVTHAIPTELAEILDEIGTAGGFRHRQHIHLAFIATRRYGTAQAADQVSSWIRHLTAHAPQKFNATVTRVWTEIVAHHVAADPSATGFEAFAEHHPELLDKRLLARHYTAAALASSQARGGWVEPGLSPFPWPSGR